MKDRHIVKHLIVCKNVENYRKNTVSMIMIRLYRLVQKDTSKEPQKIPTLSRCHPDLCRYIDALYPNVQCCHIVRINERLIILLIRFNPFFSQIFQFSTILACFHDLFMTSYWLIRFTRSQNRYAKLILNLRVNSKTESRKHTKKNGRCDTWIILTAVCKLKLANLRNLTDHRYTLLLLSRTIIIRLQPAMYKTPKTKAKSNKKGLTEGTPKSKKQAKNHDHVYVKYYGLYATPDNNDG